jgi:hypothetical protein
MITYIYVQINIPMDEITEVTYYAVNTDLTITKYKTLEDAIKQKSALYIIEEKRGIWRNKFPHITWNNRDLLIELFDLNGKSIHSISEGGWRAENLIVSYSEGGNGYDRTSPTMEFIDPKGTSYRLVSGRGYIYYLGVIELHQILKRFSIYGNWGSVIGGMLNDEYKMTKHVKYLNGNILKLEQKITSIQDIINSQMH